MFIHHLLCVESNKYLGRFQVTNVNVPHTLRVTGPMVSRAADPSPEDPLCNHLTSPVTMAENKISARWHSICDQLLRTTARPSVSQERTGCYGHLWWTSVTQWVVCSWVTNGEADCWVWGGSDAPAMQGPPRVRTPVTPPNQSDSLCLSGTISAQTFNPPDMVPKQGLCQTLFPTSQKNKLLRTVHWLFVPQVKSHPECI